MKATICYSAGILFLVYTFLVTPGIFSHRFFSLGNKTPYLTREFTVSVPAKLKVATSGGSIRVEDRDGNRIRVEMYVQKHGRYYQKGDIDLSNYEIEIDQDGSQVNAIAHRKRGSRRNNPSISFVVYVPAQTSCNLNTSGGSISLSGVQGTQDARTSGGSIELDHAKGTVSLRTSGGSLDISDVEGNISGKTSGGSINVSDGSGTLYLRTSGGNVHLEKVSGSISAHTSGGNIHAGVTRLTGDLDLRTSGGNVVANLPDNQGFNLNARGSFVDTNVKDFSGSLHRDWIDGKVKGGGPEVTLQTSGGYVKIK